MTTELRMEIVLIPVDKIIPYWRNPRRNDKTVDALCEVIPVYGFNVPIVLDENNVIVKGHARLKAAKRLGMKQVPCVYSDAEPEVIKADRIADNKIQEMSYWDLAKQELEFKRIGNLKFERLFHPEEMQHIEQDFDHLPEAEYQGTSLDDYDGYNDGDDPGFAANGNATRYDMPEYSEASPETGAGLQELDEDESSADGSANATPKTEVFQGPQESTLPKAHKALKTLCPYCGATVYVTL